MLNVFISLYENQNMHKTAEALFLTQQAVSKSIRSLEKELDVTLFKRSNTGVTPTIAGETLYQEAIQIQKQYSLLHKKMDAVKYGKKTVTLVCAYGTMYQIFPVIKKRLILLPRSKNWKEYGQSPLPIRSFYGKLDWKFRKALKREEK
ncbi:MAG: LysR family transcriptional regulator [Eubacteriales bacterium]|nr:LysR family transcriptional regulator [Eubacteriales bacterium]